MGKQTVTQRQFSLGQIIDSFVEAKDLEIRGAAVRRAENVRPTVAGTLVGRMGSLYRNAVQEGAAWCVEIRPRFNLKFGLVVGNARLRVVNSMGETIQNFATVPWTDADEVWIEPFREETVIGHPNGLHVLTYDGGTFALTDFVFDEGAGGELAQPYWAFRQKVTIDPSGYTGSITVTASAGIFSSDYVGLRIRYHQTEILLTGFTSSTVMTGTVIGELPPTFSITVGDASGFRVNDVVVGLDTNFSGIIRGRSGNVLTVATTEGHLGPDVGEQISCSSSTSKVTAKSKEANPVSTLYWDEPLISPVRGYPKAGRSAAGRLWFVGFDDIPDLVCASSARGPYDFEIGDDPDDGFLRQVGDNSPEILHIENAGDIIILTDRGLYYVPIREMKILTPNNFQALKMDDRSASRVRPTMVENGLVFVEGNNKTVSACVLADGVYTKWAVRAISTYHDATITDPVRLCGPALYSRDPEKYLFVINGDGTLAAMSWVESFNLETVGFFPWSTDGAYINIAPMFDAYYALVDRSDRGFPPRILERFSRSAYLDCQVGQSDAGDVYDDGDVYVYDGQPVGLRSIVDGVLDDLDLSADAVVGIQFTPRVQFWPAEITNTGRAGMLTARTIRFAVDVRSAGEFTLRANNNDRIFGGYASESDIEEPAPLINGRFKMSVTGERIRPVISFIKHVPGPFEILAITHEVQT